MITGGPGKREDRRNRLINQGILKPSNVFGNYLADMPKFAPKDENKDNDLIGLPEFLVRCIKKIESMGGTVGLYRVNGDAAVVQSIRFDLSKP